VHRPTDGTSQHVRSSPAHGASGDFATMPELRQTKLASAHADVNEG
jgi:hypothetical protein